MGKRRKSSAPTVDTFGVDDVRYAAWIDYLFDRPVTNTGWYYDVEIREEFEASPHEALGLIARTMNRCGTDLSRFSDAQVYHGLNFIFSEAHDHSYCFWDERVPVADRVQAVQAFRHLYEDCFEPRCLSCLGHLNEGGGNTLNMLAYMLWDVSSIQYMNRHLPPVMAAIVDVWDFALGLPNDACVESALHGLGHSASEHPELVQPVIDRFLASTCDADASSDGRREITQLRPVRVALRTYARCARRGMIN